MCENNEFRDIPLLTPIPDDDKDIYRTACLIIVKLLLSRKAYNREAEKKILRKIQDLDSKCCSISKELETIEKDYLLSRNRIESIETDRKDFKEMVQYRRLIKDFEEIKGKKEIKKKECECVTFSLNYMRSNLKILQNYIKNCDKGEEIRNSIYSLKSLYLGLSQDECGNIAFLTTMTYYSLLDKTRLNSFYKWAKSFGISKIKEKEDNISSEDSAENLVDLYEQIFQSKRNEIFISMQYGDAQSELIYEKITQAINIFNNKYKTLFLNIKPIRIDRTVESNTFSIQDTILEAIESCSLIIADLSSANINVYHEIGYAMGVAQSHNLLPNIILLYKENTDHNKNDIDIDKFVGFNLRSLSQLRFKDYEQLVDGLVERLEKHYGV